MDKGVGAWSSFRRQGCPRILHGAPDPPKSPGARRTGADCGRNHSGPMLEEFGSIPVEITANGAEPGPSALPNSDKFGGRGPDIARLRANLEPILHDLARCGPKTRSAVDRFLRCSLWCALTRSAPGRERYSIWSGHSVSLRSFCVGAGSSMLGRILPNLARAYA